MSAAKLFSLLVKEREAAAEFQKILDWPGVAVNEPIAALAHLGLARSYAIAGDAPKPEPHIRISLRSGKTPTLTSPFSSRPNPNT